MCKHKLANGNGLLRKSIQYQDQDPELAPLKEETNVLVPVRVQRLNTISWVNLVVALLSLMYFSINVVCIIINSQSFCYREGNRWVFHALEFGGTFAFAVLEVVALLFSPKGLGNIYSNPTMLKAVLFFNVVASLFSFVAILFDLDKFEIASHEVEYLNELTMTFVDGILLWSLIRSKVGKSVKNQIRVNAVLVGVAAVVAITQIVIYNGMPEYSPAPDETVCDWYNQSFDPNAMANHPYDPRAYTGILETGHESSDEGGAWEPSDAGEQMAHHFEFCFEMLSAFITFLFCIQNKIEADAKVDSLMLVGEGESENE